MATSEKKSGAPKRAPKRVINEDLIAELTEWARRNKSSNDGVITQLLSDLSTGTDLDAWSELDVLEILPEAVHHSAAKRAATANLLTIIRNIMVFVPVALTWMAVSKATTAFAEYTSSNKDSVVNFLEFWQNGYGILASEWTIGRVAFLDFAIILLVIALTLIVSFMHAREEREHKTIGARLDDERLILGVKLHKYLFSQRVATPQSVNAAVVNSVRNLQATSKAMAAASKELKKDINSIPSNKQVLAEVKKIANDNLRAR
jgi:hypothetical protein